MMESEEVVIRFPILVHWLLQSITIYKKLKQCKWNATIELGKCPIGT